MRILHVVPAIASRYGGPSVAAIGMCRALRAKGVDTLLATTDADGPGRLDVDPGTTTLFGGVPAICFRRHGPESFKWSPTLRSWLDRHVKDFDIVHVHAVFSHSSLAAARAARRDGVPYVMRPLGTLDPWSLDRHKWRKKALFALGARGAILGASRIHYTSPAEQRAVEDHVHGLPSGVVVPLGVSDDAFMEHVSGPDEERNLLFLSRLDPKKGVDLLIRAFHRVASELGPPWRLAIAGDGSPGYVALLRDLADAGPGRTRITFSGWVADERRRECFARADAFVLPSHQENFGIALVEAMAAGIPVVTTPAVNLSDDIHRAGAGWVVNRDVDSLATVLRSIRADANQCRTRGGAARRLAEQYRWPAVADALIRVYESVSRTSPSMSHSTFSASATGPR